MDWNLFWTEPGRHLAELGWTALTILATIVIAFLVRWLLVVIVRRVVRRVIARAKERHGVDDTSQLELSPINKVRLVQRTRTMGTVSSTLITWAVLVVTFVLILMQLGVNAPALIAALGLFGAALGIGAQNLVKDVVAGVFMVAEDQVGVGDVVTMGDVTGVVEYVSVRITTVRDVDGTLWFIRNGELTKVGNQSQGWARVIIDLAVPYDSDVERVQDTMLQTARALSDDPEWHARVVEAPEVWGIESVSAEALVVRLVMKVKPSAKDDVYHELRLRLKRSLDDLGVTLPHLNSLVVVGYEAPGRAAGAKPSSARRSRTPVPPPAEAGQ